MSDQTSIDSRVHVHVPRPSTTVRVGYEALAGGRHGFSAVTQGHVWMTALSGSTFTAEADGAVRVISESDHVLAVAETALIHGTTGSFGIAAGEGIRIIAGHSADIDLSPADGDVDRPGTLDDITDGCDEVATAWQAANIAVNVLFAAKQVGMAVLAGPANARVGGDAALIAGVISSVSKIATAATEVAAVSGAKVPGINMHGTGGINLFTPMFASFYGMSGTLFASPYSAQVLGLATVGVVGLATAGISSVGKADLASSGGVSVVSSGPVQIKSMPGEVVMKGSSVVLGQVLPDKKTPAQLPTADFGVTGLVGLRLKSPKGNVRLGRVPFDLLREAKMVAFVDALESGETASDRAKNPAAGAVKTLGALKTLALAPRDVTKSLMAIQAPAKDPVFTVTNEMKVGAGGVVLVKDAVKMQVNEWTVTVNKDGIFLGKSNMKAHLDGEPTLDPKKPQVSVEASELKLAAGPAGPTLTVGTDKIELASETAPDMIRLSSYGVTFKGEVHRLS